MAIKPGVEYLTQGKYKGEEITTVPSYYLEWMVNQDSMSETLKEPARVELKRRKDDPTILSFGKHRGKPIRAVPGIYLGWMTRASTLSEHLKNLATAEIERREGSSVNDKKKQVKFLMETIQGVVRDSISADAFETPTNDEKTWERIGEQVERKFKQLVADGILPEPEFDDLDYDISGDQATGIISMKPNNLFTALFLMGVYVPPWQVTGKTEWECDFGTVAFDPETKSYGVRPRPPVEYISIPFKIEGGDVTFDDAADDTD